MKSYNQFVSEAYSAREELNELFGITRLVGKGIKALGSKGFKFGQYAGRRGIGGASAGFALAKGDAIGTGLGLASMLPGPVGSIAMGAQLIRSLKGDYRNRQAQADPGFTTDTAEAETPDQAAQTDQKDKTLTQMGQEIDRVQGQVQDKLDSGEIKNPFIQVAPTNVTQKQEPEIKLQTKPEPKQEKKKRTYKDIRDRDISARAGFDPRYDR